MKKSYKIFREYGIITMGAVIYAAGIALFLDPNNLAPGGVTGIGIILSNFIPLETGFIIFLINVPIIVVGYLKFGCKLIWRTFYCVALTSVLIDGINNFYGHAIMEDLLIAGFAGGGMVGCGVGLMMKYEATTGGTDIVTRLLRRCYPHLSTGVIYSSLDCLVVAAVAVVFKNLRLAMYALITVLFSAFVLDKVLYGTDEAKLLYIISDKSREIAGRILREMEIGATYIKGMGAYNEREKEVIMIVVRKRHAPKVQVIVKEIDVSAFMIITSANEIYGDGYKNILGEKL